MNFIYVLFDPRDSTIRYVGKTDNPRRRYQMHLREKGHTYRTHWIQSVLAAGMKPRLTIIEGMQANVSWQDRERYWIRRYRELGCNLTNGTDGGDCGPPLKKGTVKRNAETRAKMSAWQIGRKLPEETCRKISAAQKGRKEGPERVEQKRQFMTGRKHHTEAFKAMMAERNRQRKFTPEVRERLRQVQLELPAEKKRRISEAVAASNRRRAGEKRNRRKAGVL